MNQKWYIGDMIESKNAHAATRTIIRLNHEDLTILFTYEKLSASVNYMLLRGVLLAGFHAV